MFHKTVPNYNPNAQEAVVSRDHGGRQVVQTVARMLPIFPDRRMAYPDER